MYLIDAAAMVVVLGGWATGADPLNQQLADALRRAIDRGDLPPGMKLPSERDLSTALGISRTTICAAYDRLRDEGIVRSRQGSGTRVAVRGSDASGTFEPDAPGLARPHFAPRSGAREVDDRRTGSVGGRPRMVAAATFSGPSPVAGDPTSLPDTIAMTIGALPGWPGVGEAIRATVAEELPVLLDDFGYEPAGLAAMRVAVAAHLSRMGVRSRPDEVVITSGAQQAVHLLARELAGADGLVAIENPTYIGAIDSLRSVGARMVPVPVGPDGLRVDILRQVIAAGLPSFVYVVPTYQNPTGVVMPEVARRELARLSDEAGLVVVEDLTPAIGLGGSRFPGPIGAHATQERVITVGSLSKGGWAGLRIGWIRAERSLISRLIARKTVADHGTSTLAQAIGARMLDQVDAFEAHAERESALRRQTAYTALRELLPDWSWTEPAGGLSIWVRLPVGDAGMFARVAADHGVLIRPGSFASPDGGFRDHIRIAVGESPERILEGIHRLAAAWAAFTQRPARPGAAVAVSV